MSTMATEMLIFIGLLPIAFTHDVAPHFCIAFFSAAMVWMAAGDGRCYNSIRTHMPAHIEQRYTVATWLVGVGLYTIFHLINASLGACMATFFFGVVPVTGALLWHNSHAYCWEAKWAERAAIAAREKAAWWAAARYNLSLFAGMILAYCALMSAMYFWTIPVLSFFARHAAKLFCIALVGTIVGIWAHCAYERYKQEVALKYKHAGHNDAWLFFHVICISLFTTAFIQFHTQAMAHVALVWFTISFGGFLHYFA